MNTRSLCSLMTTLLLNVSPALLAGQCPEIFNYSFKKLHSAESLNICNTYPGKPLLIVNTASYCGYTPQFEGLEKLHRHFKDKGLAVIGFASGDFNQEAGSDKDIAKVCYINYGVTFPMLSPIHVKGESAHPLFKALGNQSNPPKWNFNKYLVDAKGNVTHYFDSNVTPDSPALIQAIEKILARH